MKKREWIYIQEPAKYEMFCDKCGGVNITWSEFEGHIWCYDCKIDTIGIGGIFDGPIPLELSKMFGVSFDRYYFKDKSLRKMEVKGNKLIWRK
jgi:hypothetical protein